VGLASGSLSQATEIFGSWPRSLSIPESHERNMFFTFFKRTDGDFPDQMGDPWWMVPEHVAQLIWEVTISSLEEHEKHVYFMAILY
jgi:hypothetical protein